MPMPSYTVRSGDTLGRIAKLHYDEPELALSLARFNHIANPDRLSIGHVIHLPPKANLVNGAASGHSMSPPSAVEYSLYVRRYAPFRSFGGGFEGDGRGFSTSLKVTSRTVGVATFLSKSETAVSGTGYSTGSSWVGPWEVRKKIPAGSIGLHTGQVRVTVTKIHAAQNKVSFTLYTEGNLPLKDIFLHKKLSDLTDKVNQIIRPNTPRPQGTPDIDTFVDFCATFSGDTVIFEALFRGDGFPNAEVFVLDSHSKVVPLIDYRTKSGVTGPIHRLLGTHSENRLASVRRQVGLSANGSFAVEAGLHPVIFQEA